MKELTQEYLKTCIKYDELTGNCFWLERPLSHFKFKRTCDWWNSSFAGKIAGSFSHTEDKGKNAKYKNISVDNVRYVLHRVIWLYVYGEFPKKNIDHIDGSGLNNKINNLRDVSQSLNTRNKKKHKNNTSGTQGVYWRKDISKWIVTIPIKNGKRKSLGFFVGKGDAINARVEWESKNGYGENSGK